MPDDETTGWTPPPPSDHRPSGPTPPEARRRRSWTKPAVWAVSAVTLGFLGAIGTTMWTTVQGSLPQGTPLTASLDEANEFCTGVVLPEDQLASLPDDRDDFTLDWAYEKDIGEYYGTQGMTLVLQGLSDDSIVVTGLEVIDYTDSPPPDDAVYVSRCDPIGGDIRGRFFSLDVSSAPPLISARPGDDGDQPVSFPYEVSADKLERFDLTLSESTTPCTCEWRLAIDWRSAGREGRLIVDRNGEPFRTVIPDDAPMLVWYENGELRDPYE